MAKTEFEIMARKCWNVSELAEIFDVHRATITKRIKDHGVPHVETTDQGRVKLYLLSHIGDAIALSENLKHHWQGRMNVIWKKDVILHQKGKLTIKDLEEALR